MKYCFIILLFLSLTATAQKPDNFKWTEWRAYDTLKCDSIKVKHVQNCIMVESPQESIYKNKLINGEMVYVVYEQYRICPSSGIRERRNAIIVLRKNEYEIIKDSIENCVKKKRRHGPE